MTRTPRSCAAWHDSRDGALGERGDGQRWVDGERARHRGAVGDEDARVAAQLMPVDPGPRWPGRRRCGRTPAGARCRRRPRRSSTACTRARPSRSRMSLTSASDSAQPRSVFLVGSYARAAAAEHLLRDADGVAGRRRRPEHALVVVLRHGEDGQPGLPVPQHLLLLRAEPAGPVRRPAPAPGSCRGPAGSTAARARTARTRAASRRGGPSTPRSGPGRSGWPRRPVRRGGTGPARRGPCPRRCTAVFSRSPLPEKYRPTACGIAPRSASERCRITGVAPAPAASDDDLGVDRAAAGRVPGSPRRR